MAEGPGLTNHEGHFDIMVIGNTGVGKTTTADKLLLANPTNCEYVYTPPGEIDPANSAEPENSTSFTVNNKDLTLLKTSNEQDSEKSEERVRDLLYIRHTTINHHEVINEKRENSKATTVCELISNDTSRVRVLDVPGFFSSSDQTDSGDALRHMEAVTTNNLATMRTILQIKRLLNFKFNRIVYFLPEKGVLRRDTEIVKSNIRLMKSYFGKSIFAPMIVVATQDQSVYEFAIPGKDLYPPKCMKITRENFHKAMSSVFPDDTPTPPIVFLSLLSSCDEVLSLFQKTVVHGTCVELEFSDSTCSRCNITIQRATHKDLRRNQDSLNQDREDSICRYPNTEQLPISYYDSMCHPMLIPKHTRLEKVAGGIVRIISLGLADREKWPWFWCEEEKCIHCGRPPGTRGCQKVGSKYNCSGGSLTVDHTHMVWENFVIIEND